MASEAVVVQWFKRFHKPVRKWLRKTQRVKYSGDIDDLAQEVFLRALRYDSKTMIDHPAGYLFKIAANVAAEWRERSRNSKPHSSAWLEDLVIEDPVEEEFSREALNEYVREMIAELPPRQQSALMLHVYDKLTYAQIAKRLDISERMALRDLTNAYSKLRFLISADDQI